VKGFDEFTAKLLKKTVRGRIVNKLSKFNIPKNPSMNIIITGASQGIGRELVRFFARNRQNHVIAISRNGKELKELAAECLKLNPEAKVTPYEFDLEQFEFYPFIVQRIETFIPRCDILINNAGRLFSKPFKEFPLEDFDAIFNVNIKGPFFFTQALLPMMTRGSHIVNISSLGGIQGSRKFSGLSAYSASKAALAVFTESLAEELMEEDIFVNCLALGGVQTEMFTKAFPGLKAQQTAAHMAQYIAEFAITGQKFFNGKVIQVSNSVP
jgi:NAD(P)-dependent dehydrogenase (short-subunit alcohol dehydrogenase family)